MRQALVILAFIALACAAGAAGYVGASIAEVAMGGVELTPQ